ncbi:hypothetical protein D3C75_615370 [compost metagenome]
MHQIEGLQQIAADAAGPHAVTLSICFRADNLHPFSHPQECGGGQRNDAGIVLTVPDKHMQHVPVMLILQCRKPVIRQCLEAQTAVEEPGVEAEGPGG